MDQKNSIHHQKGEVCLFFNRKSRPYIPESLNINKIHQFSIKKALMKSSNPPSSTYSGFLVS